MRIVRIVQCLCPHRHCIMAIGYETEAEADPTVAELLRTEIQQGIDSMTVNPWCALCLSQQATWIYEDRPTPFTSMVAAEPLLKNIEAMNMFAQANYVAALKAAENN